MVMNEELITLNEVLNGGNKIFFYQSRDTGMWVAYGYSAYLLFRRENFKGIASFSRQMQMPCVCVSEVDFKNMLVENKDAFDRREDYYFLSIDIEVDEIEYQKWVKTLK